MLWNQYSAQLPTISSVGCNMKVLAVDPGVTTGLAYKKNGIYITKAVTSHDEIFGIILNQEWDIVVCEMFITAGRVSKYGIDTIELIGALKALCKLSVIKMVMHTPSQRKPYEDKAAKILSAQGKFMTHQKDALSHLLKWEYDYAFRPSTIPG